MKTKEELEALKEEYKTLSQKLAELTEEELKVVIGGASGSVDALRTGNIQDPDHPGSGNVGLKNGRPNELKNDETPKVSVNIWDVAVKLK